MNEREHSALHDAGNYPESDKPILEAAAARVGTTISFGPPSFPYCNGGRVALYFHDRTRDMGDFWKEVDRLRAEATE